MRNYYVYHISFFESLLIGLERNGINLNNLTRQSFISRFDLKNPDTYLPIEVGYEFFRKVKDYQGVDCISSEFYSGFQIDELSDYGKFLSRCPDLFSILTNAIRYDYLIQSSGKLSLRTDGPVSYFTMRHVDTQSDGRLVSEKINVAMILKAFKYVLGSKWTPIEIQVTSPDGYWIKDLLPTFDFNLKTDCRDITIVFKTVELASKNRFYSPGIRLSDMKLDSIEQIAESVFKGMNGNYIPTLKEFADFFGYSSRTCIRHFSSSGKTYRNLVDRYVFTKSLGLLENTALTVNEISFQLGYSHASNFIRAFKAWTSSTPEQYRQLLN